ncbi:DUF262 domain-containing protein [Patescibacteria group bacterium]|nr:DUF262 domain-containing protein [Patescibacteria group bacterium]
MATKVYKFNLKTLISFVERNHVAVPEFQRGYVWKIPQVKKLFDSLIKKYPIGSLVLWQTSQKIDARSIDGNSIPTQKFLVLDGQQRLLSLYYLARQKVFSQHQVRDSFHDICDTRYSQLIDFDKFFISKNEGKYFLDYDKRTVQEIKFKKLFNLIGSSYMFPVIIISLENYKDAIEIFERINQAGTKIATESIFLSETWTKHTDFEKMLRIWKRTNKESLTRDINTVIFIHVFALVFQLWRNGKNNRGVPEIDIKALKKIAQAVREEKDAGKNSKIFSDCIKAVSNAMQYLKREYGIISVSELPSQTLLTVLSIFFYFKNNPTLKQQAELKKWFWRASLSNRYIGSGYNRNIGPDAVEMKRLATEETGLTIKKVDIVKSFFDATDIKAGRSSVRNIVKLALWRQKPVYIDGSPVNRIDLETQQHGPEDDHFYPFDLYRKGVLDSKVNNILNLHYLNKDQNVRKGKEIPSRWLKSEIEFYKKISNEKINKYLKSELLPFKSIKKVEQFDRPFLIRKRGRNVKRMRSRFNTFLHKRFLIFREVLNDLQAGR